MEDSSIQSSLTDMMTSLMVIFILLLVTFLNQEYLEKKEKTTETNTTLTSVKKALEEALLDSFNGVSVENDPNDPFTLVVVVPEGHLRFGVNQYDIPSGSSLFLKRFTPRFVGIMCGERFSGKIESVLIEGHTDSSADDTHNLALSQKRSLEVMLKMLDYSDTMQNCFLELSSASGRGEKELIYINGFENAEQSRRVQYKIRVKSLVNEEFKEAVLKSAA